MQVQGLWDPTGQQSGTGNARCRGDRPVAGQAGDLPGEEGFWETPLAGDPLASHRPSS